jgi:cysteine desulfurase/selenocysteine lyase
MMFDVEKIRAEFPLLKRQVHGRPIAYLDNAATTLKPKSVIDTVNMYNSYGTSNVHRGVHLLSEEATRAYESARSEVRRFINAKSDREVILTSGTTMSINLVAHSYGRAFLKAGDEIIVSQMEHHSNIVPWQMLCESIGAKLRVIPINDAGELDMTAFRQMLSDRTKLVAVVHISNALGTVNPVREIVSLAHDAGAVCLIDGAQAVAHTSVDVQAMGCDFYCFSGHKLFAETGVGVLYGRERLLEAMPPFLGGGDMIRSVSFSGTTFAELPSKFEAGTPNISGVMSLTPAIKFLDSIGLEAVGSYETELLNYGTYKLQSMPGVRLVGTAKNKASILSFVLDDIHPHDIGTLVDEQAVAIRTGHHCAQPVMERYQVPATARASLSFYNTKEEIDRLCVAIRKVQEVFA